MNDLDKIKIFLDYFNNYLTYEKIASDYNKTRYDMKQIIIEGKRLHEINVIRLSHNEKVKDDYKSHNIEDFFSWIYDWYDVDQYTIEIPKNETISGSPIILDLDNIKEWLS